MYINIEYKMLYIYIYIYNGIPRTPHVIHVVQMLYIAKRCNTYILIHMRTTTNKDASVLYN